MVDMAHHRNDGRTTHEVVLVVFLFADRLLHLGTDIFGLEAELIGHHIDGFRVETLVDGHHDTNAHERRNDLCHADIHHRGQLADRHKLGQFQYLAVLALCVGLLLELLLNSFALLLTVLGALLVLVALAGQTGERLLYLACYGLIVHLQRLLVAVAVFLLAAAISLAVVVSVGGIAAIARLLIGSGVDVDTLFVDTDALLAFATMLGGHFLLAFLPSFLFSFLLGTRALVDGVQVNLAQNVHLGCIQDFLFALQLEHAWRAFLLRRLLRLNLGSHFLYGFRYRLFLSDRFLCRLHHSFDLLFNHRFGLRLHVRGGLFDLLHGYLHRLRLRLGTDGSSHFSGSFRPGGGNRLHSFRLLLTDLIEVYLAQRLELLLGRRSQQTLRTVVGSLYAFLFLVFLLKELLRLAANLGVLLEGGDQSIVLVIVQLKARLRFHFTQFGSLFQEFNCRLKSYVQFT